MKKSKLRAAESPRASLINRARRGGITLVVGAGVSISRGVPDWESLAKRLWVEAFGKRRSPWQTPDAAHSPTRVPQFLPIIFELAYRKMGEVKFLETLNKNLYSKARYPGDDKGFKQSNESLAVIARLLLQEREERESKRRIDAVITFNADDLIEQAVNAMADFGGRRRFRNPIVLPIARGTHSHLGQGDLRNTIPIYHIHGFVPSNHTVRYGKYYDHMLVFTDVQYWSLSVAASAFANRITASALSEGRCIFIGLSMTDINLLRWFAMRAIEKDRDFEAVRNAPGSRNQEMVFGAGFQRHFWIRPPSDDPTGFMSEFLSLRGVQSVAIDSWAGPDFQALMEKCFSQPVKPPPD